MKLATYKDGSRDGQLVVVSRDLKLAHYASSIANRMQDVLDDWNFISPQLQDLYEALNRVSDAAHATGMARHAFPFDATRCMAPLPRAYQWADGSAYINHVELVRLARHAEVPANYYTEPLMYQGGSDDFWALATMRRSPARPLALTLKPKSPSSPVMCRWVARPSAHWMAFAW